MTDDPRAGDGGVPTQEQVIEKLLDAFLDDGSPSGIAAGRYATRQMLYSLVLAALSAGPAISRPEDAPTCGDCEGKGWISPDDAERQVVAAGEMFNAGYEHRKQHFEAGPAISRETPWDVQRIREFVGWLSADIPELHHVEVPRLIDSLDRFAALDPSAPAVARCTCPPPAFADQEHEPSCPCAARVPDQEPQP